MTTRKTSRRSVVAGLTAAPIAGIALADVQSEPELFGCWATWRAAIDGYFRAWEEHIAAYNRLPEWAKPGPEFIGPDGGPEGAIHGAPRDLTIEPPTFGWRKVRRTLADARQDFEIRRKWGEVDAQASYVADLRRIARTRMAARAERAKIGLPALEAAERRASAALFDAANSILEFSSASADAVAAKVIVAVWTHDEEMRRFERIYVDDMGAVLRALQPRLTGSIRADVAFLLSRTYADELAELLDDERFRESA